MESSVRKEILVDLQEKYDKVRKLLDEDSKNDPHEEPYRSKYTASGILNSMKSKLVKLMDDVGSDATDYFKYKAMLGVVSLDLGITSIDTEELSTGEEQLVNTIDSLSEDALKPEVILIMLTALNQLGILWSERGDPQKSKEYLEKAEKLYKDFTAAAPSQPPVLFSSLFHTANSEDPHLESENVLEKLYTHTLYYLAQIYGSLNDHLKSAVYCHTTLKRQLESKDFDAVEWALNAATLSQYFMEKQGNRQARHHLAAAAYVLDQYEADLSLQEQSDELEARKERFQHRSADVARCWAKYGLHLLSTSKERLMSQANEINQNSTDSTFEEILAKNDIVQGEVESLWFSSLELSSYEDQITDTYVLIYEDARKVFLNAQSWLNKAKKYYALDGHASDYVQIIQDMSQLYKYLAFFEEDEERQSRMHKRRIDNLESVLKELNPQYYLSVCRQLWYELGETYSDILNIKLQRLQMTNERPTPHALRKINHLIEQSILHFNNFIESIKDQSSQEMPSVINEDLVRPVLIAYFHIGGLYRKIVTQDKLMQLENMKRSLEAFKFIVDYCKTNDEARRRVAVEYIVCEDMVKLLPLKMEALQKQLA